jgi:hypothetical protein
MDDKDLAHLGPSTKPGSTELPKEVTLNLKKAISDWEFLSQTCFGPSRDEKEIQEVRAILQELKEKMKAFEGPEKF